MGYHIKNVIRGAIESEDVERKNIALRKALVEIERLQTDRKEGLAGAAVLLGILCLVGVWATDYMPF